MKLLSCILLLLLATFSSAIAAPRRSNVSDQQVRRRTGKKSKSDKKNGKKSGGKKGHGGSYGGKGGKKGGKKSSYNYNYNWGPAPTSPVTPTGPTISNNFPTPGTTPRPTMPNNLLDAFVANRPNFAAPPAGRDATNFPAPTTAPTPVPTVPPTPEPTWAPAPVQLTFAPGWMPGMPSAWWPVAAPVAAPVNDNGMPPIFEGANPRDTTATPVAPPVTLAPVAAPTDSPTTASPVAPPVTWQPVTWQPVTWQPVTWQPVTWQPVTWQPISMTNVPTTEKPSFAPVEQTLQPVAPVADPVAPVGLPGSLPQPVTLSPVDVLIGVPVAVPVALPQPTTLAPLTPPVDALTHLLNSLTPAPTVVLGSFLDRHTPPPTPAATTAPTPAPTTTLGSFLDSLTAHPTPEDTTFQPVTAPVAPLTDAPVRFAPVAIPNITSTLTATQAPVTITSAPITTAPITAIPTTTAPVTSVPTTLAPITSAPITSAPITAAPITSAPVTSAPVTLSPITPAPVTSAPITALNPSERTAQIYRREYISNSFTIGLEGDFELASVQDVLFEVMEKEMRPYLIESFGPALEDFELSVSFQYARRRRDLQVANDGSASSVVAQIVTSVTLAHPNANFVEYYSQEEIDRFVHGFFDGQSLYHLQQRIIDSGIPVNAIVTQDGGTPTNPGDSSKENDGEGGGSMTALIAGALSGGLVVVGLAAAVLCRQQRYGVENEMLDGRGRINQVQKFLSYVEQPSSGSSIRIVSYDSSSDQDAAELSTLEDPTEPNYNPFQMVVYNGPADGTKEYMLDAPKPEDPRRSSKTADVGFKMVDGPDLVAPANWDDGQFSMAESTVYTRSNPSDGDRLRPEYDSKKRGQRFRPWDTSKKSSKPPRTISMTTTATPSKSRRPAPGEERSRLWRPFNKAELKNFAADDNDSMKARASSSRDRKKIMLKDSSMQEEGVFLAPLTRF